MKGFIFKLFLSCIALALMHNLNADPGQSFESNDMQLSDLLFVVPPGTKFVNTHAGVTNNTGIDPFVIGPGTIDMRIYFYSGTLAGGACLGYLGQFSLTSSLNTISVPNASNVFLNPNTAYKAAVNAGVTPADVDCITIQLPNNSANCSLRDVNISYPNFHVTLVGGNAFYADTSGSPVSAISCN